MAASTAKINFKVKAFVDRPGVMAKVKRWQLARLSRAGAYARGAMKKQIRPALKGRSRKDQRVIVPCVPSDFPPNWRNTPSSVVCIVPKKGPVLDARTDRPVSRHIATKAQILTRLGHRGRGEGQPPRRGPTDKLRKHIYFAIDTSKPSVVIGPAKFPKQPPMQGRVSVPQLLNKGGIEIILGAPVPYGPRPFVETILKPAMRALRGEIRKHPLGKR